MTAKFSYLSLLVGFFGLLPLSTEASITFLGPTPYLSAADSPFPVGSSNFFLEDFEDGMLNTPGISLFIPNGAPLAGIIGPSSTTDSVDGDDGTIDGSGTAGTVLRYAMGPNFTSPPNYSVQLTIRFSEAELGFLPNAFGLVWTDGPATSQIAIAAFNKDLVHLGTGSHFGLGDLSELGETAEDRFFGVTTDQEISTIVVGFGFQALPDTPRGIIPLTEIDHLQYGFIVPEPATGVTLLAATFLCPLLVRNRGIFRHNH